MSKRITSSQLSTRLGYPSEKTLSRWRQENIGPPFKQICGRVFYDLDEVEVWERSNLCQGTTVGGLLPPDPTLEAKRRMHAIRRLSHDESGDTPQ